MENENKNMQTPFQEEGGKRRRTLRVLLVLLILLALFSSVTAGFLIGRNTDPYRGQIIDTILIGPDQEREIHVSGQVLYTNGTPYENGQLELHSEPLLTTTDGKGRFFYESVAPGSHTLSVVDESGSVLAQCDFTINRAVKDQPLNIQQENGGKYQVELSVNVRFIELAIELDTDEGTLKLLPEKTAVLEDDGTLTVGEKQLHAADGTIVLPTGTVVLQDNTVVLAGHLILPDNVVTAIPEDGYTGGGGEQVNPDGSILLPDGTLITAEGVTKPDGSKLQPDQPYQISSTTDTAPSGTASGGNSAKKPGSTAPSSPTGSAEPSGSTDAANPNTNSNTNSDNNEDTDIDVPGAIPGPPPSIPEDSGSFGVTGQNASGWSSWDSQSTIDLFYDRTGTLHNDVIQPGSKGYYMFQLENSRRTSLTYEISIAETSLHLPMQFRLSEVNGNAGTWQTISEGETLTLRSGSISSKAIMFRLEWEWPYDSGNDRNDTAIGTGEDRNYLVTMQVHAEE